MRSRAKGPAERQKGSSFHVKRGQQIEDKRPKADLMTHNQSIANSAAATSAKN